MSPRGSHLVAYLEAKLAQTSMLLFRFPRVVTNTLNCNHIGTLVFSNHITQNYVPSPGSFEPWEGVWWVLENPLSSLLFEVPEIKAAAEASGAYPVTIHLGGFGSNSSKPLTLLGNAPWLRTLADSSRRLFKLRQIPPCRLTTTSASGRVTGGAFMPESEEAVQ